MNRPQSIAEIAERTLAGTQKFDPAVREFVDAARAAFLPPRTAGPAHDDRRTR